jgi:excisionase family DNA binding protein
MKNAPITLKPKQVAERLGVNSDKVLAWIRAGELSAINVAQKASGRPRYRIDPVDLAAFEAHRRIYPKRQAPQCRRRRRPADAIEYF